MRAFWLLTFLMSTPYAHAAPQYDGIFSILNEHYVENISDLPPATNVSPDKTLNPGGDWFEEHCTGDTQNNCVYGWLDIIEFRGSVRNGDTYYIRGDPADSAVVQYQTYVRINGRYLFGGWKYDLQKYVSNGILTAKLTATAILYQIDQSGYVSYANETRTFYDSEPAPEQYPELSESKVIITQYNNSLYENIGIKILGDNYTKISFDYRDKHATRTLRILHAENNSKGIVYGNITELEQWKIEGAGISRFYNEILIDGNLSKMAINELDIRVYNPYTSKKADPNNFTIERVEFAPQRVMNGLLIAVIGMVSTFSIGTLYLFNRTVYRWNIRLF